MSCTLPKKKLDIKRNTLKCSYNHTHYTVGGKCIHHQHIMDAASTLREFDARFLYGNCELFIDSCVIGQMLVVYWRGT